MKNSITKKNIDKIQNFAKKVLRKSGGTRQSLASLATDNCSELSRLAGCFVLKSFPEAVVHVLKGNRVCNTKQSHDILAIQEKNVVYAIDPSVWQFFPRKRSIFVSDERNLQDSLKTAKKIYGGMWKVSEKLSLRKCQKDKGKWLTVINQNNKK
ncbi:MAG: hypothetical protein NUW02_00515 [Candidatus Campbellbacteria bacterium]|nr:hypothetical protein [Candidatus Campbellbacteria bacterium]